MKISARQDENYLVVGVSDKGPRIKPEDRERLFQSFERLGAHVDSAIQGTGLGPRVCRIRWKPTGEKSG